MVGGGSAARPTGKGFFDPENKKDRIPEGIRSGTPEGTRTPDLLIRSQSLYPTELPAHFVPLSRALRYNIMGIEKSQALF